MKNIKYEITEIRTTPLVLEIPQMSDERWQELARKNAVRNYTRGLHLYLAVLEVLQLLYWLVM